MVRIVQKVPDMDIGRIKEFLTTYIIRASFKFFLRHLCHKNFPTKVLRFACHKYLVLMITRVRRTFSNSIINIFNLFSSYDINIVRIKSLQDAIS